MIDASANSALPALPSTAQLVTPKAAHEIESRIAATVAALDNLEDAAEWHARAEALATYLKAKDAKGPMLGAMRRIEARIGELLGPAPGRGRAEMSDPDHSFDRRQRADFRTLAEAVNRGLLRYEDDGDDTPWRATRQALVIAHSWLTASSRTRARERQATDRATWAPVPLSEVGLFPVLYVDPPWRYEDAEPTRAVENHYPTMSLEELWKLDVPAADDSVLLMWTTSPKLAEAVDTIERWEFEYRTCMVWVKDKIGMGHYARQRHELLLLAKRGDLPTPPPTRRPDSVIEAPRGEHSTKPLLHDVIDRMWPGLHKIEMFARDALDRPWWTTWGNEVPA